jgi:hypothetical protein
METDGYQRVTDTIVEQVEQGVRPWFPRTLHEFSERVRPMIAYFMRRSSDGCSVIKLHPDNEEEVVQSGLTLLEAEILCVAKIADLPKFAAPQACHGDPTLRQLVKPRRDVRQLALKL